MIRRRLTILSVLAVLILTALPATAGVLEPVISGSDYQAFGSSNGVYVAWSQNNPDHPLNSTAYAAPLDDTSAATRLNASGTRAFTGGFDPGTNTVIYQQTNGDTSNIFLYDLDTSTRTRLPDTVNSDQWEYKPRISNAFVMFIRSTRREDRLFLWDRIADTLTLLDAATYGEEAVYSGTLGEQYATWTRCTRRTCLAMYYDTGTQTTSRVPPVKDKVMYAPTIDEGTGQIFYVRSAPRCGRNVRFLRAPLADITAATVIGVIRKGHDTNETMFVVPNPVVKGQLDLWFDRYACGSGDSDVYVMRGVQP